MWYRLAICYQIPQESPYDNVMGKGADRARRFGPVAAAQIENTRANMYRICTLAARSAAYFPAMFCKAGEKGQSLGRRNVSNIRGLVVLLERIELSTSPLLRESSEMQTCNSRE